MIEEVAPGCSNCGWIECLHCPCERDFLLEVRVTEFVLNSLRRASLGGTKTNHLSLFCHACLLVIFSLRQYSSLFQWYERIQTLLDILLPTLRMLQHQFPPSCTQWCTRCVRRGRLLLPPCLLVRQRYHIPVSCTVKLQAFCSMTCSTAYNCSWCQAPAIFHLSNGTFTQDLSSYGHAYGAQVVVASPSPDRNPATLEHWPPATWLSSSSGVAARQNT